MKHYEVEMLWMVRYAVKFRQRHAFVVNEFVKQSYYFSVIVP